MRLAVLGTDTGVGKTVVSAALARAALRAGHAVSYWKPLATGAETDRDTDTVGVLAGPRVQLLPESYTFLPPVAPHVAAEAVGVTIDPEQLTLNFHRHARAARGALIVEGIGGALVPLAPGVCFADWLVGLDLSVVLVARTALGTINHTLLTLETLRARGLKVLGVVMSGPRAPASAEAIVRWGGVPILAELESVDAELSWPVPETQADASEWLELDRRHVWRPYTPMKLAPPPLPVLSARGARWTLADGRSLVDGTASWWVNAHGHGHPRLVRAMAEQAARLDQVIYASCAHEPGARLAAELSARVPGNLPRVFYTDDGSTAVEAAIKIAYQSWRNHGDHGRKRLVALEGAYHGDTLGAMSAGADGVYHAAFRELLFGVQKVRVPGGDPALPTIAEAVGDDVFAVIVEPMVQGAAGMRTHPASFLAEVRARTAERGIPLIADEVFTGFGRTGRLFACEHAGVVPDLLCLSKALTGGLLPLGATLASEALFQAFWSDDRTHTLFHGHSYTGNPIACAVARESLKIMDDERVLERVRAIEALFLERTARLVGRVRATRVLGAIVAIELEPEGPGGYLDPAGARVARRALEAGVHLRPLGDVVYLVPPYAVRDEDLHRAFDAIEAELTQASGKSNG